MSDRVPVDGEHPNETVPCRRCGNPRKINAYCNATDECRRRADEDAAAMQTFIRTGTWPEGNLQ